MSSLGDFHSGCTIFDIFTTTDTSGRPTSLGGSPSPCLLAYRSAFGGPGGGCTTAGITLSINCEGRSGVNSWSVNTNIDPAFYACGNMFQVLLSGGCVDSICVSGYVVARFSLNATSGLRPQVHGRNCVAITPSGKVEIDPCGSIFSVTKVIERPVTDPCSTIFSVQKLIEKPVTDACSTIFSVVKVIERPVTDPCSTIFSVVKLIEKPITDACSTIFSVVKLIEKPVVDSCSTIFSVQRVVDPDTILDKAIVEPTGVFSWPATLRGIIGWLGAVASNQIKQEAGQQGVCDRAVSTTIAKATTTDDGTTATRGSFT